MPESFHCIAWKSDKCVMFLEPKSHHLMYTRNTANLSQGSAKVKSGANLHFFANCSKLKFCKLHHFGLLHLRPNLTTKTSLTTLKTYI